MDSQGVSNNSLIVRSRLMDLIRSGALGAEGRLPTERELCVNLAVSRRAVRLAIESLEAEGLVWRRQGKGTFAGREPDPAGVVAAALVGDTTPIQVMEARLCIEPMLASLCASRALPDDIARMRHLAGRVAESRDADSTELWDGALHRLIAECSHNRPLMTMVALLDEVRTSETWRQMRAKARSLETLKVSDGEHRAIIEAIAAGQADAAGRAMHNHLSTLMGNITKLFGTPPPTPISYLAQS